MKEILFIAMILVLSASVTAQLTPFDHTEIEITNRTETDERIFLTVRVTMSDLNDNADGDGGKVRIINGVINDFTEQDWERQCSEPSVIGYECIGSDSNQIQWFNFVDNDSDSFEFNVEFGTNGGFIVVEEIGGMECGAYYQTAQSGPFRGYGNIGEARRCAAVQTTINGQSVQMLGGFPASIPVDGLPIEPIEPRDQSMENSIAFIAGFIVASMVVGNC